MDGDRALGDTDQARGVGHIECDMVDPRLDGTGRAGDDANLGALCGELPGGLRTGWSVSDYKMETHGATLVGLSQPIDM